MDAYRIFLTAPGLEPQHLADVHGTLGFRTWVMHHEAELKALMLTADHRLETVAIDHATDKVWDGPARESVT